MGLAQPDLDLPDLQHIREQLKHRHAAGGANNAMQGKLICLRHRTGSTLQHQLVAHAPAIMELLANMY